MKLIMILAASLLPFLHETRYPAEVKGCDAQGILAGVVHEPIGLAACLHRLSAVEMVQKLF